MHKNLPNSKHGDAVCTLLLPKHLLYLRPSLLPQTAVVTAMGQLLGKPILSIIARQTVARCPLIVHCNCLYGRLPSFIKVLKTKTGFESYFIQGIGHTVCH